MVNMMKPDIPRKPLENLRQLIEGTALESCFCIIPFSAPLPVHILKLVLNIEEPNTNRTRYADYDQLDQNVVR